MCLYLYNLIINQTFWIAIGTIASIIIAYVAVVPLIKRAKLGSALFEDAVQIDILPDGVFRIFNIFDEPIKITSISQNLIRGSELNLKDNSNLNDIMDALSKNDIYDDTCNKIIRKSRNLAPKLSFILASTLTHLPEAMEKEVVWIVITEIKFESMKGKRKTSKFKHRFSKKLEPRNRWVEIL